MGRDPAPRRHYRNDAITLNRIIGAIELDQTSDMDWKSKTLTALREGFRLLVTHNPALPTTPTKRSK